MVFEAIERRPATVFAGVGIAFALVYVTALTAFPRAHGRLVDGDGIQYYAYLRSLAIDRDLDFTNDYELLYRPTPGEEDANVWLRSRTPLGRPTNVMSIGPAILWSPFFLMTWLVLALARPLGVVVPLDGIATPFQLSAGVAGIAYAALGAYFCYRSCRVLFPDTPSFWAALAAWLATPAVYYSLISPVYSHAASLFTSALFVWAWLSTRGGTSVRRFAILGALAGLAALVRWQDIVLLLVPALELIAAVWRRRTSPGEAVSRLAIALALALVVLLPQLLAWHAIYGEFLLMPQGEGFMRWTDPAIVSVLFSLNHGLFTWTPAVLLAAAGLLLLVRRDPVAGCAALALLLLAVYVNASVADWWAGEAFGARRFVGYTVVFALGFAAIFARVRVSSRPWLVRVVSLSLVAYNLLFLLQYQLFMRGFRDLAPYPTTVKQVFFDRLLVPWQLLRAWLS